MADLLPDAYLLGLIGLLAIAAVVVARQILRVRRDEVTLSQLGGTKTADGSTRDAASLYTLASVQLRKRLYGQATDTLKAALKQSESESCPAEATALMENAMGFALAAQSKYPAAIRHYRAALKAQPDYPVALNNLAFALEKQGKEEEARQSYNQVLALESNNKTALRRLKALDRRAGVTSGTSV
ncbi:MAG: tetratricopeptide repeat protein [Cyanobacteriota bacterium]|nr:tetratricopeptide repeat protein [Cyanobacteriota bacterium]